MIGGAVYTVDGTYEGTETFVRNLERITGRMSAERGGAAMTNQKCYVNMDSTNPVLTVAPPKEKQKCQNNQKLPRYIADCLRRTSVSANRCPSKIKRPFFSSTPKTIASRSQHFFVDDGVSGVTFDRPGFQAMLLKWNQSCSRCHHEGSLSRMGRNPR